MWSTKDQLSLEFGSSPCGPFQFCPSFNFIFWSGGINLAKDCIKRYGPIVPQGIFFKWFQSHVNNIDSPWSHNTYLATKLNSFVIDSHRSVVAHYIKLGFNSWISHGLWFVIFHSDPYFPFVKTFVKSSVWDQMIINTLSQGV